MVWLAERTYEEAARLARDPKTVISFRWAPSRSMVRTSRCSWTGSARRSWRG